MDFFAHQDGARRNTRVLIALYLLAVCLIIATVYLVVAAAFLVAADAESSRRLWDPFLFSITALALIVLIGSGTLYKVMQLGRGGDAVARLLGGVRIEPGTADPDERRLLNVVEEMAIAAGMTVPGVYLLEERGINAFAAGFSPGDAVIGVTRGCLRELNRDELQGVVAHEFSHILYGDMRLNLRLMGVLHGILLIAMLGYFLLRGSLYAPGRRHRSRGSGSGSGGGGKERLAMIALGIALMVIGYIGVFFARLIKSAVSRQREFLADAAAVQFTRNPAGLGGALSKIADFSMGSRITHPDAEEASHLFFANGLSSAWFSLLATHPPLPERIRRIDPALAAHAASARSRTKTPPVSAETADDRSAPARSSLSPVPAAGISQHVGQPTGAHLAWASGLLAGIPEVLSTAAHHREQALAVLAALLVPSDDVPARERQEAAIRAQYPELEPEVHRLLPAVHRLGALERLPLLDLAFSGIRDIGIPELERFRALCEELVRADGEEDLFEFTVLRMLSQALEQRRHPGRRGRVDFPALRPLVPRISVLLAALARQGQASEAAYAAGMRRLHVACPPMPGPEACGLDAVAGVLADLERASPTIKRQLVEACAETIATDGSLSAGEGELLRAVAAAMDCPLPPLQADESVPAAEGNTAADSS